MDKLVPQRSARHIRRARTAYSPTCAHLRMNTMITQIVCGAIPGFNQSKNGTMNRDVCSADITFIEPIKITPSQPNNGNQYFKKDFIQRSARKPPNIQQRTPDVQWQTIPALSIERWTSRIQY